MPLALIALAWLLVMTGINGNYTAVGQQFDTDVIGSGGTGFVAWLTGLIGIAVFFRLIGMPNAGRVFLVLVILVFVIQNSSVLTALENLGGTVSSTGATAATTPNASASSTATSSPGDFTASGTPVANATPLTTPAPGTGSGGIGSA